MENLLKLVKNRYKKEENDKRSQITFYTKMKYELKMKFDFMERLLIIYSGY